MAGFIGQRSVFSVNDEADFQCMTNQLAQIHVLDSASLKQRQTSQDIRVAE